MQSGTNVKTVLKFLTVCLLLVPTFCCAQTADDLPEGPGKSLVVSTCRECHELDTVTAQRDTREGWTATVNTMRSRGASGADQDFQTIIDYLAKNFGSEPPKINVNTAASKELESSLGLTTDESTAIVQYRKDNGDFKDWESLTKVKGVDPKKLAAKKDQIVFGSRDKDAK
jgi:competence ComEA-like helix-hairpin-helix protein